MKSLQKLSWIPAETPQEIAEFLRIEAADYPICEMGEGKCLRFVREEGENACLRVETAGDEIVIHYSTLSAAARGVGAALSGLDGAEETPFRSLGLMLDVSRGMVMTVPHLKFWMRRLALCGCTFLMLYCEDTYQLEGEPMFGYMRGAYTAEELRELDAYSRSLGIELCGCIQTLGHLLQMLKWPVYHDITDTQNCLLVDEEKTYGFIDKMIRFWSENLQSRKIHIGMDETHDLGLGQHLTRHGYENGFDMINRHLARVNEICGKYGLSPMMWGDMYFRYGNDKRLYYDLETHIPKEVAEKIPEEVRLVYWDYYHRDEETYLGMIERHREIGKEPVMASGIWTWGQVWYNHDQTERSLIPCISACRKAKLDTLFFTLWGDDGGYCNYDSALAGLFIALDLAYGCTDVERTKLRFDALCQSDYETHTQVGDVFVRPKGMDFQGSWADFINLNALLWDDPLIGHNYNDFIRKAPEFDLDLIQRCEKTQARLAEVKTQTGAGDFSYAEVLLDAVAKKMRFRRAFEEAYDAKDRVKMRKVQEVLLPDAVSAMERLSDAFRTQWLRTAKPFGLEIIQVRHAGQIARLKETMLRIGEFLDGKADTIPELDGRLKPGDPQNQFFAGYRGIFSMFYI